MMMYALSVPTFYALVLSSSSTVFTFECNPASFSHPYHCFPHLHLPHSLPLLSLLLTIISVAFSLTCFPLTLTAAPHCSYPPLTLTSVLPHQLHTLGREHGKTKASHQKLLSESQNKETQLTQVAEARERLLMEQQSVAQAHHVQQTRMQATIAQQSKLIDYLQGTPRSRLKIKKVIIALFLVSFPDPQQDPPYRGSGNETTLFSASHTPTFLQAMKIGDMRG